MIAPQLLSYVLIKCDDVDLISNQWLLHWKRQQVGVYLYLVNHYLWWAYFNEMIMVVPL